MAKTSTVTKALLGTAFALGAMTAANDAMALERGCQDANVVRAAMVTEGQMEILRAVRPIPERPINIFTTNANGSLGYNIEQGTGNVRGQLCVIYRFTDIVVNQNVDFSQGNWETRGQFSIPNWAWRGDNSPHDQWLLRTRDQADSKVMMGARMLIPNGQGGEMRGTFMMVSRNNVSTSSEFFGGGGVSLSFSNGNISPELVLANVTPNVTNYPLFARANANRQIASLNVSNPSPQSAQR